MDNLVSHLAGQEHGPGKPSRRKFLHLLAAKFGFIALLAQGVAANAAEVKVMAGAGMRGAFGELVPQFERATGHKIVIQYGGGGALESRSRPVKRSTSSLSIRPKWMILSSKARLLVIRVRTSSEAA